MMLADDLLPGAKAAATFLGLTPRKIYKLSEEGHLPVVRVSGRLYFRKSELDRLFSSGSRVGAGR